MTQQDTLTDIETRAKAVGIDIKSLCQQAGVHPTSFSRWKRTADNPEPPGANLHKIEAIYSRLIELEKAAA